MKAIYDNKPSKFEAVGNGSYFYRWGIKEIEITDDMPDTKPRVQYGCNEVIVWATVTANKITRAVISELWDSDYEQKLINEYNSAVMGILDTEVAKAKIEAYKSFLAERNAVKEMVDADCKKLGIH